MNNKTNSTESTAEHQHDHAHEHQHDHHQHHPGCSHMKKIGRNDPCFCGSGKKFKKCCLLAQ